MSRNLGYLTIQSGQSDTFTAVPVAGQWTFTEGLVLGCKPELDEDGLGIRTGISIITQVSYHTGSLLLHILYLITTLDYMNSLYHPNYCIADPHGASQEHPKQ